MDLKAKMKADAQKAFSSQPTITVSQNNTMDNVPENAENTSSNERIGNWNEDNLFAGCRVDASYQRPAQKELPNNPTDFVPNGKISEMGCDQKCLAITHSDGSIEMAKPDLKLAATTKNPETKKFLEGDPVVRQAVLSHEINHSKDHVYLHVESKYNTPVNAAKYSNLTENVSFSVSYLSVANTYQNLKNQGVETIKVNNETRPLDSVLDTYPGLRETYEKHGLDLNDPQSLRRYAELGVKYKNDENGEYDKRMYNSFMNANNARQEKPFANVVAEAKSEDADFDKTSHAMVSKVYIDDKTCVDLSPCYDILSNKSTQDVYNLVDRQSNGKDCAVPSENIVAVNNYLNTKNIPDDEKGDYITEQYFLMLENDPSADKGLKEIMLQSQTKPDQNSNKLMHDQPTNGQIQQSISPQTNTPTKTNTFSLNTAMMLRHSGRV